MIPALAKYRPASAYAASVLADSPIAYWRLNESSGTVAHDSSGNGRAGTFNSVTLNQASLLPNGDGASCSLAGSGGSNISTAAIAALNNMTSPLTLEAWVRPASLVTQVIYAGGSSSPQLALSQSSGSGFPYIGRSGVSNGTSATTALSTGTSYHVVVTVDASGNIQYYVNGAAAGGPFSFASSFSGSGPSYIGSYSDGVNYLFNGRLQDVAIYGTALSAARVLAHWHAAGGTP